MGMFDIAFAGEIGVDFYSADSGIALPESTAFFRDVGGVSAKMALGCSSLGLRSCTIAQVAGDTFGTFLRERMKNSEVELIEPEPHRSPEKSILYFHETGPNSGPPEIHASEAPTAHRGIEIPEGIEDSISAICLSDFRNSCALFPGFFLEIASKIKNSGGKLILNLCNWNPEDTSPETLFPLLEEANFIFCEQDFPEKIRTLFPEGPTKEIVKALVHKNAELLVLKDGGFGYCAHTKVNQFYFPFYSIPRNRRFFENESFIAGVLYGLFHDFTVSKAIRYGAACEALASSRTGGSETLPNTTEVENFLAEHHQDQE